MLRIGVLFEKRTAAWAAYALPLQWRVKKKDQS
jgi:hypothetical protein